jgi:hypothetical protein
VIGGERDSVACLAGLHGGGEVGCMRAGDIAFVFASALSRRLTCTHGFVVSVRSLYGITGC